MRTLGLSCASALLFMVWTGTAAAEIQVAVASNFSGAIKEIAARFEDRTGNTVALAFGSTGKLYAQIRNGAPYDVFFAADVKRPELLEQQGAVQPGGRFTYAVGRVVLWSPQPGLVDADGKVLNEGGFRHLALANPRLAPYGKAAEQVLKARGLWQSLQARVVRGENIAQTFQFVKTGNAELGFVAYSQIQSPGKAASGSLWNVPQSLYDPIEQQAVLLTTRTAARDFMEFVKSPSGKDLIRGFGYGTP